MDKISERPSTYDQFFLEDDPNSDYDYVDDHFGDSDLSESDESVEVNCDSNDACSSINTVNDTLSVGDPEGHFKDDDTMVSVSTVDIETHFRFHQKPIATTIAEKDYTSTVNNKYGSNVSLSESEDYDFQLSSSDSYEDFNILYEKSNYQNESDAVSLENEAVSLETEEGSLETEAVSLKTEAVSLETESVSHEYEAMLHDDESMLNEDEAVSHENEAVSYENELVSHENEAALLEDDSVSFEAALLEDESALLKDESVLPEDEALSLEDIAVSLETKAIIDVTIDVHKSNFNSLQNSEIAGEILSLTKEDFKDSIEYTDGKSVEFQEMSAGVKVASFFAMSNPENVLVGYLNIGPRTVKPFERSQNLKILYTILRGKLVVKSTDIEKVNGVTTFVMKEIHEGNCIAIPPYHPYTLENRTFKVVKLQYIVLAFRDKHS